MKNAAVGGNRPPNRRNLGDAPQAGPCITRLVLSPVTTGWTHIGADALLILQSTSGQNQPGTRHRSKGYCEAVAVSSDRRFLLRSVGWVPSNMVPMAS
jgi:hypothetical protein